MIALDPLQVFGALNDGLSMSGETRPVNDVFMAISSRNE
jgi:hypothetical protein